MLGSFEMAYQVGFHRLLFRGTFVNDIDKAEGPELDELGELIGVRLLARHSPRCVPTPDETAKCTRTGWQLEPKEIPMTETSVTGYDPKKYETESGVAVRVCPCCDKDLSSYPRLYACDMCYSTHYTECRSQTRDGIRKLLWRIGHPEQEVSQTTKPSLVPISVTPASLPKAPGEDELPIWGVLSCAPDTTPMWSLTPLCRRIEAEALATASKEMFPRTEYIVAKRETLHGTFLAAEDVYADIRSKKTAAVSRPAPSQSSGIYEVTLNTGPGNPFVGGYRLVEPAANPPKRLAELFPGDLKLVIFAALPGVIEHVMRRAELATQDVTPEARLEAYAKAARIAWDRNLLPDEKIRAKSIAGNMGLTGIPSDVAK
jgi:hypothetical protein